MAKHEAGQKGESFQSLKGTTTGLEMAKNEERIDSQGPTFATAMTVGCHHFGRDPVLVTKVESWPMHVAYFFLFLFIYLFIFIGRFEINVSCSSPFF